MIKNYKKFNEGLLDKLQGPTQEEIFNNLKNNPTKLLKYSIDNKFEEGIKYALKNGAEIYEFLRYINFEITDLDSIDYLIKEYGINTNQLTFKIKSLIDDNNDLLNTNTFRSFIKNGLDVNFKHDFFLRVSAYHGYVETAKLLLEKGSHADILDNQPIYQAAMNGHLEMVKLLEENGADVNTKNYMPLRLAASGGYIDVVRYCLTKYTTQEVIDGCIEEAEHNKHYEVVKLLKSV